jgi:hypothetical protein
VGISGEGRGGKAREGVGAKLDVIGRSFLVMTISILGSDYPA